MKNGSAPFNRISSGAGQIISFQEALAPVNSSIVHLVS
eukprot:COSAG02_NODE_24258_length_693_cov_1.681818_1_plen_37_part_10